MQMLSLCRALEKWHLNLCVLSLSLLQCEIPLFTKKTYISTYDRRSSVLMCFGRLIMCLVTARRDSQTRMKRKKTGHADDDMLSFDVTGKDVKCNHETREQETQRA